MRGHSRALLIVLALLIAALPLFNAQAALAQEAQDQMNPDDSSEIPELTGNGGKTPTDASQKPEDKASGDDTCTPTKFKTCGDKETPEDDGEGGESENCGVGIIEIITSGGFSKLMSGILGCGFTVMWENVIVVLNDEISKLVADTAFSLPDIGTDSQITQKYDALVTQVKGGLILGVLLLGAAMMLQSANFNTQYAVLNGLPKIAFVALALAFFPQFMTMVSELATGLSLGFMKEAELGRLFMELMVDNIVISPLVALGNIVLILMALLVFGVSLIKNIIFSLLYIMGPLALVCYPLPGVSAVTAVWFRGVIACFVFSLLFCVEILIGSWLIQSPSLLGAPSVASKPIGVLLSIVVLWIMWKTPFKVLEWAFQGHASPGRGSLSGVSNAVKGAAKALVSGAAKGAGGAMVGGGAGAALASAATSRRKGVAHAAGGAAGQKIGEKLLGIGGGSKKNNAAGDKAGSAANVTSDKAGIRKTGGPHEARDPREVFDSAQDPATDTATGAANTGTDDEAAGRPATANDSQPDSKFDAQAQERSNEDQNQRRPAAPQTDSTESPNNAINDTATGTDDAADKNVADPQRNAAHSATGAAAGAAAGAATGAATGAAMGMAANGATNGSANASNNTNGVNGANGANVTPNTATNEPAKSTIPATASEQAGAAAAAGLSTSSASGMDSLRAARDSHSTGAATNLANDEAAKAYENTLASARTDAHNMADIHESKAKNMKATATKSTDSKVRGKLRAAAVKESQKAAEVRGQASEHAAAKAAEAYSKTHTGAHSKAMGDFTHGAAGTMAATKAAGAMAQAKANASQSQAYHKGLVEEHNQAAGNATTPGGQASAKAKAKSNHDQAKSWASLASDPTYGGSEAKEAHQSEYEAAYKGMTGSAPKSVPKYDAPESADTGQTRDWGSRGSTEKGLRGNPLTDDGARKPTDEKG